MQCLINVRRACELANGLLAIATHAHSDHIGGIPRVSLSAPSTAPRPDSSPLPGQANVDATVYAETVVGPYRDAGYDIPQLFLDAVPTAGMVSAIVERPAAPATRLLDDGDVIDLGDRAFEVLHLPGHSPGSIGLWEAATGTLFSGDAVYDGPLLDELDGSDIDDYVATMQRLRALPVTVVHGGHEPSFGRQRLLEICDIYLARHAA